MTLVVVLTDANIIFPRVIRDYLMYAAEAGIVERSARPGGRAGKVSRHPRAEISEAAMVESIARIAKTSASTL